jgi:hypothetical protein
MSGILFLNKNVQKHNSFNYPCFDSKLCIEVYYYSEIRSDNVVSKKIKMENFLKIHENSLTKLVLGKKIHKNVRNPRTQDPAFQKL